MKKYNRTLLVALLIAAVFATAIGGTFAWFTDVETSGENVIQSGNLDIVVEYARGVNDEWAPLTKDTKIFDESVLYEPGYTETVFFRISNAGNLALKYKAGLSIYDSVIGKSVMGNEIKLSDYLQAGIYVQDEYSGGFNYWEILGPNMFDTRENTLSHVNLVDLKDMTDEGILTISEDVPLLPGEQTSQIMALVLHMPTTVGNEANHVTGTVAPQIKIGLNVDATQYTYENDSFDNQYDKDAEYGEGFIVNDDTPQAVMTELEEDQLTVIFSDIYENVAPVGTRIFGEQVLDCGVVLRALEDDATGSPYEDYYVDLLISCDKAITPEAEIVLGGHYDFDELATTGEWLGCKVSGLNITANERIPVMGSLWGNPMRYYEIINNVKEFYCGVICSDFFNGSTITLELVMYEPSDTSYENPIVIGSPYTYTHN